MDTTYRPAHNDDLPAMRLVQGLALRDLAAREGLDPSTMPLDDQPTPPMRYLLRSGPDMSWVALRDGRVAGFSQGFVRGDLWFLSNLFVHPEVQSGGVGAALLQKCVEAGMRRGVRIRAVCSSPERAAQALYARNGMIPRFPLFALEGHAEALRALPSQRGQIVRPKASSTWIRRLGALDEYGWGRLRDADHRFAHRETELKCLAISAGTQELAGYVYYCAGQIGPLCARTPRLQLELLRAAGDALGEGSTTKLRVWVPGINAAVLVALLEAGFRIAFSNLFMASRPFGRFDRYVPSGGTLL
ncbi:MAG TPA: GNAT family N-acetyltransferase [Candidatus Binataceae bacterium]|jgi:ribosomal protein S18 acetylase RimI-like enzyme|nr:GNAT family N-acetyltransferase [Candidatus Binataceae bacterium]